MSWVTQILKIRRQLRNIKKYDVVLVRWDDIVSDCVWVSATDMATMTAAKCVSMGILIEKNNSEIKISSSYNFEDASGAIEVLPIGCITNIDCLKHKLSK